MTNHESAKRLIELINAGKNVLAEEELYAVNVVSYEQDGTVAHGLPAIIEKTKAAMANAVEFHGGGVDKAYIGPDSALLHMTMDFTTKSGDRVRMDEYGFYRFEDGKVVEEHFFMSPLA